MPEGAAFLEPPLPVFPIYGGIGIARVPRPIPREASMRKLYVIMVGLPARGKSTLARRIREGLEADGRQAAIFNNGDLRRRLLGAKSTSPEFYRPDNAQGRVLREELCRRNLDRARQWLAQGGDVAILDATNGSAQRRAMILEELRDHPALFIECVNEDPLLLDLSIRAKAKLPEYAAYGEEEAVASFRERLSYYEAMYTPAGHGPERFWIRVDAPANRILREQPCEASPVYPAIREVLVCPWVRSLYLVRHGQTEFNLEGRIGGDPPLTPKGREQAQRLARRLRGERLDWLFTSTRRRSHETAAPLLAERPDLHCLALKEFDEIFAGDCEGMRYDDIRATMPQVTMQRNADKYGYAYPHGESYAMLRDRVRHGVMRALFLARDRPTVIVGHQAINRVVLALFLKHRKEDIPYLNVPQDNFYHLSVTPQRKLFERISY